MQNVPKIVRERLKAEMPVAPHPDADVLTAFAERSLPELDRAAVLEHLARCGDCRDVVALALPEPEAMQTVFVPAQGWLAWPGLRWGFVTAGIVAIAAVGFLEVHRHQAMTENKEVARFEAPASPAQTQSAGPASTAAPAETKEKSPAAPPSSGEMIPRSVAPSATDKLITPPTTPPTGVPAASAAPHSQFPHGPLPPTQWQQQVSPSGAKQQATAVNRVVPSASEMVEVQSSAPLSAQAEVSNQDSRLQVQPAEPEEGAELGGVVGKAKPVVNVDAASVPATHTPAATVPQQLPAAAANVAVNGRNFAQLVASAQGKIPRWTISSAGSLERSFDQGNTWQEVDVNATPAAADLTSTNYTSAQVLPQNARVQEIPANKKVIKAPTVIFRALAVNGADVWAGGFNAALYHSADAGSHWTQVVPSFAGAALSGDVVAVEFSDAQHGKVTTSTPEVWITADGGQTWQKQ